MCHNLCMVKFRRCFITIMSLPFADSSAAANLACTFLEFPPFGHRDLWTWCWSFSGTRLSKISWPDNSRWRRYTCSCACCSCSHATVQLLFGMHIPDVSSLQWLCSSTTICFISLHMPLRNFMAIGFKIKEISFFLCSLSLLPRSRGAVSWCACCQKSVTPFNKSIYPHVYREYAHVFASWFDHRCHDGRDIGVSIFVFPIVQKTVMWLALYSCFPANERLKHHVLLQ